MARNLDPFRDIDRLFGEVTRGTQAGLPLDLYRSGDHFVAELDLPGVDPASIDIDIDDRTLTVRAERTRPVADDQTIWLVRERVAGTVARQLTLGRGIATDQIVADYRDGVLVLTIPVDEEAKPRKISVQHSSRAEISGEATESD
ncbi:Hsp20/alpha crystallin family protein [Microlunatus sp. Y2014]|uniref:Hsp20/alpha crystallin family protein n=1 Tax=Microlunatus sp. Y2014 TaxID=3418488 RepID=UPI003DA72A24